MLKAVFFLRESKAEVKAIDGKKHTVKEASANWCLQFKGLLYL